MAAVGDERLSFLEAELGGRAEAAQPGGGRGPAERDDLDGHGVARAQAIDPLGRIDEDDQAAAGRGDELLAQERPAAPLEQGETGALDLVGAVDGDVEERVLAERGQRDAELARQRLGARGGRDAGDAQPLAHAPADRAHRGGRGGAGAQADDHAVRQVGDRPLGGVGEGGVEVAHDWIVAQSRAALRAEPARNHASWDALYEWRRRSVSVVPSSWATTHSTGSPGARR